MVSTPEINDDIHNLPMTQTTVKKPSARKSLRLFTKILYAKNGTAIRRVVATNSKRRAIKSRRSLWKNIKKWKGNSKINQILL